jgi:hypothetical protein
MGIVVTPSTMLKSLKHACFVGQSIAEGVDWILDSLGGLKDSIGLRRRIKEFTE